MKQGIKPCRRYQNGGYKMAFKSGFFNALEGDRTYNADDLSEFYYGLISDGVLASPQNSLAVSAGTGMAVVVRSGRAMVQYKYFINTENYELAVQAAGTDPRIDRVVLRLDIANREITLQMRTGTAAASPQAPTLTRSESVYELSLAQIYVAPGAVAIVGDNITDERPDVSVCGMCAFNTPESYAYDAGENAIVTSAKPDIFFTAGNHTIVEVRCHDIGSVTPAPDSWATGSIAWEIPTGKFYALDTNGEWVETT